MTRPSPPELFAEMARLSHALHWPLDTVLDLEHADRRSFLLEVESLALAGGAGVGSPGPAMEPEGWPA